MRILKGLAAKSDLPTQETDTPLFGAGAGRATDDECGNDGLAAPLFKQATLCSAEARAADLHVLEAAEHEGRRQVLGRALQAGQEIRAGLPLTHGPRLCARAARVASTLVLVPF